MDSMQLKTSFFLTKLLNKSFKEHIQEKKTVNPCLAASI